MILVVIMLTICSHPFKKILVSKQILLQIMTQLEGVIKREFLSSDFETTTELLGALRESDGSVPQLPWIPQTTAAVALRLLEIDSSIFNTPNHKSEKDNAAEVEPLTVESSLLSLIVGLCKLIILLKKRLKSKKDLL